MSKILLFTFLSLLINVINFIQIEGSFPDTLLIPVNSELRANCGCGKIGDLEKAKKGEFPWIVTLISKNSIENEPLCWGSLINDRYILSAAHCTSKYSPVEVEILLASSSPQQNPRREVSAIKNHPGFSIGNLTYDNDISLIKLRDPIDLELQDVTTVCIPPETPSIYDKDVKKLNFTLRSKECDFVEDPENRTSTMSKFKGFQTENNRKTHQFDKINLQSMKNLSCSKMYPKRIKAQVLCAEVAGEMGKLKSDIKNGGCRGDSGSPLIYLRKMKNNCDADFNANSSKESIKVRFLQIGISTAQSEPECQPNPRHPVLLFTKISRYISWIYENTKDGTYCINSPN